MMTGTFDPVDVLDHPDAERLYRDDHLLTEGSQGVFHALGGLVGYTVRVTKPSRSSARNVAASIFWEMPLMARRTSLNRLGADASSMTTMIDHLSPTRDKASEMHLHS